MLSINGIRQSIRGKLNFVSLFSVLPFKKEIKLDRLGTQSRAQLLVTHLYEARGKKHTSLFNQLESKTVISYTF